MDPAPGAALFGALFSAAIRPDHANTGGISLLLLVSTRNGDRHFGVARIRLSQTEDLMHR